MDLFSERMGFKQVRNVIQVDGMEEGLRVGLWNALYAHIWCAIGSMDLGEDESMRTLCVRFWADYLKYPVDELDYSWPDTFETLKKLFFDSEWYEVYDFVEFVANNYPDEYGVVIPGFIDGCNDVLRQELSAYRFVGGRIARLTSDEEIAEIEEALEAPDSLAPVSDHLKRALDLFADRKSPDHRNSIKESILAVEGLCQLITGDTKATLGQALKLIEDAVGLHGALKAAFSSLYGYTSDAEGIRHALLEEPTLDFEDAKFMLVACSAFKNYLVEKASKAGTEL